MEPSVAQGWGYRWCPRARRVVSAHIGATPVPCTTGAGSSLSTLQIYDIRGNVGFFSRHLTSHIAQGLASAFSRCDPLPLDNMDLRALSLVASFSYRLLAGFLSHPPGPLTGALYPSLECASLLHFRISSPCAHSQRTLSQTFRFPEGILGPSTAFVKRNPEQTQRPLLPASETKDEGVIIVFDPSPAGGVNRALQDIEAKTRGQRHTVLTLGRYRRRGSLRVEFSTVRRAKGREEDYVIVLDLNDGRWRFPSKVENDPLLELVLPPPTRQGYPFAEERRLFYVAMTRARIGAYLVTDPVQPSRFVTELLKESDELRQIGEVAQECPRCRRGRLRPPMYLICSDSNCDYRAPRCPNCDAGYALVRNRAASCTNRVCRRPPTVCPRCRSGVLRAIDGKFGLLWGCSEYGSKSSCRYKRDIKFVTG